MSQIIDVNDRRGAEGAFGKRALRDQFSFHAQVNSTAQIGCVFLCAFDIDCRTVTLPEQ